MKTYLEKILEIKDELTILDNRSYNTVEEAKESISKYDSLLDSLADLILNIIIQSDSSKNDKEELYIKAVTVLSNYIGSAKDTQKYETVFNNLYKNRKINQTQLDFFYESLNLGRWG